MAVESHTEKLSNHGKSKFKEALGKIVPRGPQIDRSNWHVSARDRLGDFFWKWAGKFHPAERLQYLMDTFVKKDDISKRSLLMEQSQAA